MGKRKIRILFQVHLLKRLANAVNFPDTMAEEVHFIIKQTCEEQCFQVIHDCYFQGSLQIHSRAFDHQCRGIRKGMHHKRCQDEHV